MHALRTSLHSAPQNASSPSIRQCCLLAAYRFARVHVVCSCKTHGSISSLFHGGVSSLSPSRSSFPLLVIVYKHKHLYRAALCHSCKNLFLASSIEKPVQFLPCLYCTSWGTRSNSRFVDHHATSRPASHSCLFYGYPW